MENNCSSTGHYALQFIRNQKVHSNKPREAKRGNGYDQGYESLGELMYNIWIDYKGEVIGLETNNT